MVELAKFLIVPLSVLLASFPLSAIATDWVRLLLLALVAGVAAQAASRIKGRTRQSGQSR